ncbi:MAG TPA: BsuPI-related putative proteinase inhibitor [Gemmatimonadales bacterium]|nr:BsuPI-related putative proteinase inhibitor [Gemmatimonadales bacterium]
MKFCAALLLTLIVACARPELQVELTTDKSVYRSGEPIEVTVKVTNRSNRDTALQFASSQRYDFQIIDPTGATQWTWSADRTFMQVLGSEGLRGGQSIEYREQIPATLAPGRYQVTGMITTMGRPLQASATISVE